MWRDDEVREEVRASADIVSCPQRGVWILYLQQEAVGGFETEKWHVRLFRLLGVGEADEGDNGELGGSAGSRSH